MRAHFLFVTTFFFSCLGQQPSIAAPLMRVAGPTAPVSTGAEFDVAVELLDGSDVIGFQFDLVFDSSKVSAMGVTEADYLSTVGSTIFFPGSVVPQSGIIDDVSNVLISGSRSGAGAMVKVHFLAVAPGVLSIRLLDPLLIDGSFVTSVPSIQVLGMEVAGAQVPEPGTGWAGVGALVLALLHRRGRK